MKNNGFTMVDNNMLEYIAGAGLSSTEMSVLLILIRYINGYNRMTCDVSFSRLAKLTKKSERAVITAVKNLREKGFVSRKNNGTHSNTYIIIPRGEGICTPVGKACQQV